MGRFVLFTLVLAACGDTDADGNAGDTTNPGTVTDPGDETALVDVSIFATIGGNDIDGIVFDIQQGSDSDTRFSGTTTYTATLASGSYTVSEVSGTANDVSYVACGDVTTTISTDSPDIEVPLTIDLEDTSWTCYGDEPDAINVVSGCEIGVYGISEDGIMVDGRTFTYDAGGMTFVGTFDESVQHLEIVATVESSGSTETVNCDRD